MVLLRGTDGVCVCVCVCVFVRAHTYACNTFAKRRCDMTTMTQEYVCAQTKTPGLEEEAMNCMLSKYFVGLRVPTESDVIAWLDVWASSSYPVGF